MARGKGKVLIGVDTNILLRFVLKDEPTQASLAGNWMEALSPRSPAFVSLPVLCEFASVLARIYREPRSGVAESIAALLGTSVLHVERPDIVREAVEHFTQSGADFTDCCIAALAKSAGCEYTITFDKAAAKLPDMRLLV